MKTVIIEPKPFLEKWLDQIEQHGRWGRLGRVILTPIFCLIWIFFFIYLIEPVVYYIRDGAWPEWYDKPYN